MEQGRANEVVECENNTKKQHLVVMCKCGSMCNSDCMCNRDGYTLHQRYF